MGFPIRKCPDQSLFAAPRTLSQRTTSFIASQRQGIHRILLRHLIVLIDNAHPVPKDRIAMSERPVLASSAPGHHAVRHDDVARWTCVHQTRHGPWGGLPVPNTLPLNNDKQLAHASLSQRAAISISDDLHAKSGGARRDRTDDLMLAKHALSQLSYGPTRRRRVVLG